MPAREHVPCTAPPHVACNQNVNKVLFANGDKNRTLEARIDKVLFDNGDKNRTLEARIAFICRDLLVLEVLGGKELRAGL